ncbi:hypothetical protein SLS56_000477 [Neofusicoccum ribis]|uniref:F-box domain protein n=1 Tax=Neofusicoccum ribis TaxID=45134 RepID=A0ABR3TEI5_9PEZI
MPRARYRTRCQHLEAFYFVGPSHHLNSDRLLGFISRHPTLSDIRIRLMDSIIQHPLPEDVVTYLAEKSVVRKIQTPQLQLHTPKSFTSSDTFRTLELLDIRADYRSLHIISASLPRLKILKVGLAASSLRHLQEIGLFFTPEAVLDIDWTTETIFPNLSRLCLNQIRGQKTNYSLDTYDARLRKKFPRLQLLQVMKPFPGSLSLGDSFIFDVPRIPRSDPFA